LIDGSLEARHRFDPMPPAERRRFIANKADPLRDDALKGWRPG
jgi:hypothetical protein